jgi:serine/threonine-protein kinase
MAEWSPRANEIFAIAVELPPPQRQAYLEQACNDEKLRRQVEALLAAHARAGSFLDRPAPGVPLCGEWDSPTTPASSGPPLPAGGSVVRALAGAAPVRLRDPDGETASGPGLAAGTPAGPSAGREELPERYQVEGEIARGGMGRVLKGTDTELGREIAVKVLLETHAGRTELVQRFVEEAQIAGQLQHPGITPVYDVGGLAGQRPYFTMKLVKGETLAKLLAQRESPGQDRARFLKVFESVCQTIAYAHARGVIHRDLKPANIMVGRFGEVQVMDWGLAKVLVPHPPTPSPKQGEGEQEALAPLSLLGRGAGGEGTQTQAGSVLGTPAYMAPEQARGEVQDLDERADVFGLGAILCQVLTGQPPYTGKGPLSALDEARQADLTEARARLDGCGAEAELIALARACLEPERDRRPADGGAVAGAVSAYLARAQERAERAEIERAEARIKAAEERKRRRAQAGLAAALLALVVGGSAGWVWLERDRAERRADTERQTHERHRRALDAIQEAELRREQAWARTEDRAGWAHGLAAAAQAVRRAEDVLTEGPADADLRQRARALAGALAAEERQRRLVEELETIRLRAAEESLSVRYRPHPQRRDIGADYRKAFREYGLDVEALPAEQVAEHVRTLRLSVCMALESALDDWARRSGKPAPTGRPARPRALADAVMRDTGGERPPRITVNLNDRQAVKALTDKIDVGKYPAHALCLLGLALGLGKDNASPTGAEDAIAFLRRAQRRHPHDLWVNFYLLMFCATSKPPRGEEARQYAAVLTALRPEHPGTHRLQADLLMFLGEYEEACVARAEVVRLQPSAENFVELGIALREAGKVKPAIAAFRAALKREPNLASAHRGMGGALARLGNQAGAEASFQEALRLAPRDAETLDNYGAFLCDHLRRHDDAVAAFRKALQIRPDLTGPRVNLAVALMGKGDAAAAGKELNEALRQAPESAEAHRVLGALQCDFLHRYQDAAVSLRRAIELSPKDPVAHFNLGQALMRLKDTAGAEAAFRQALRLAPGLAEAHDRLGDVLFQRQAWKEAARAYRLAIRHKPGLAGAHNSLGTTLDRMGDVDGAIAAYRAAIRAQPKFPWAYKNLGGCLVRKGDRKGAIAAFTMAIRQDDAYADAHYDLGNVLREAGDLTRAVACYRRAVALRPDFAEAHCNLGTTLRQAGDFTAALAALERGDELGRKRPGWPYPSARWVKECQALLAGERKLAAVIRGEAKAANAVEQLALATIAQHYQKRHALAARLYAEAFAADAKLADLPAGHRYNAARAAALAAAGQGVDTAALDGKEKARLRRQALNWLRADLAWRRKQLESWRPGTAEQAARALRHWQKDPDLASLRGPEAVAGLPEAERQELGKLWAEVGALVAKRRRAE